jgi:glutamine synthetase
MSTDEGENLLEPGNTPSSNVQFLLFLTAIIKAVDEYQDLLRISVASAGNDHRLGANEAPPAIVSMFVGEELEAILNAIISGSDYTDVKKTMMSIGASVLPPIPKDTTDRNRTSPFAFTGNKFEFRMLGSSANIGCTNTILNTSVAESLRVFSDELEAATDFESALMTLIQREVKAHKNIIFNGNGYGPEWPAEAEKRGLLNLRSTPDALPHYTDEKNVKMFAKHGVYTATELKSREDILLEEYSKTINIEALTMIDMLKKDILPACIAYSGELADVAAGKEAIEVDASLEKELAGDLSREIK